MQGEIYNVKNTNDIIAAVYKAAYARADQTQGVYTESIIARNGTVGTVGKNMQQDSTKCKTNEIDEKGGKTQSTTRHDRAVHLSARG